MPNKRVTTNDERPQRASASPWRSRPTHRAIGRTAGGHSGGANNPAIAQPAPSVAHQIWERGPVDGGDLVSGARSWRSASMASPSAVSAAVAVPDPRQPSGGPSMAPSAAREPATNQVGQPIWTAIKRPHSNASPRPQAAMVRKVTDIGALRPWRERYRAVRVRSDARARKRSREDPAFPIAVLQALEADRIRSGSPIRLVRGGVALDVLIRLLHASFQAIEDVFFFPLLGALVL